MIGRMLGILAVCWGATPALAHPHVFIDAGLEVIFDDQGRATALRVSWTYDAFYSLVIVEERGLDPDFDGAATALEAASLAGFDMAWDAGFPGDTYALMNDADLALSRPGDWTASYADGKITSTHLRHFEAPVALVDAPLIVQVYDPGYYTAYAIVDTPVLSGAKPGCTVEVYEPDPAAADALLQAAIDEMAGSSDVEGAFPAIGKAYSEEARISCAPAS